MAFLRGKPQNVLAAREKFVVLQSIVGRSTGVASGEAARNGSPAQKGPFWKAVSSL